MYEAHWNLKQRPFESGWDSQFYYPSESHQGALLKLRYGVENRRGAVLLVGATGLGKTLLVEALRRQLPETTAPMVHVTFPQMPADELLAYVADRLGAGPSLSGGYGVHQSVRRIERMLGDNARDGKHAVLVVDEAHLLADSACFESLRLLLNFQSTASPDMTLLLVGQPSLLSWLERMPGLEQRFGVKCLLRPMTVDETASYVTHRLTAAGADRTIFEGDALEAVHELTHGVARNVNRVCDLALLIAFAEQRSIIGRDQVESVYEELVHIAPE
jgi:general secretion pathway protein A